MKGPKNSDARRAARLRTQRFLSELIRDFSAINPETAEADARQMMADVAALPNKKKTVSAFARALYDDKDNVAGMRGNANAVARFLVEIGVRPNITAAEKYVDRLIAKRRPKRQAGTKKIRSGAA
jgi:hypothetical protein